MTEYIKLKKSNCKNCYKCIRHCPVKSIKFSDNQAHIIDEDCILCGQCFVSCPQNAKEVRTDIRKAKELIRSGRPVYASIAPSFIANFGGATIHSMEKALQKLGFSGAEETASGAAIVKKQYEKMISGGKNDIIISSCCHTVNLLIQKYYPAALPYLARVLSPMQAHAKDIKSRIPGAAVIFICPCISKKAEAETYSGEPECVLTFGELSQWLHDEKIVPEYADDTITEGLSRLFPTAGGILKTMEERNPGYTYMAFDGIDNCIRAIEDILESKPSKCFIEMSACAGSCIGGPVLSKPLPEPIRDYKAVINYARETEFTADGKNINMAKEMPTLASKSINLSESSIAEILKKMGKTKPEHELNCGTCGYGTCRDKARAVLMDKANLTMCLPFLKDKAESFSDNIINNTPNAIIVLNETFEVQQINAAACRLLSIGSPGDVLGSPAICILDIVPFAETREKGMNRYIKQAYLAEYRKYVHQTIIYDENYHIFICIMRDITDEVSRREQKEAVGHTAIEIADKVIEKQMRIVHEIASLLGETTAETKIALTKLKESLKDD